MIKKHSKNTNNMSIVDISKIEEISFKEIKAFENYYSLNKEILKDIGDDFSNIDFSNSTKDYNKKAIEYLEFTNLQNTQFQYLFENNEESEKKINNIFEKKNNSIHSKDITTENYNVDDDVSNKLIKEENEITTYVSFHKEYGDEIERFGGLFM